MKRNVPPSAPSCTAAGIRPSSTACASTQPPSTTSSWMPCMLHWARRSRRWVAWVGPRTRSGSYKSP